MDQSLPLPSPILGEHDLQTILEAWNTATERLQKTHELLRDEVKRLTDELEEKNHELSRKNRLADIGQMASHVAHEVRNGLVPMKLYLSLLRRRVTNDNAALELVDKTNIGFQALESVVNDLLQFTSHREPQWSMFDPHDLCEEICDGLQPQFAAQQLEVTLDFHPETRMQGDREMLRRALLNLVLNALDVMPHGGKLHLSGECQNQSFTFSVTDSGPGIPENLRPKLFEPFFTTKSSGTGLGLAIVERIAEVHGGVAQTHNEKTGGATFTLQIPQPSTLSHSTRKAA